MEALKLVVALVGHLAWPLALLVVVLKFAPTIRVIGERATKLKVAGTEIELARRLEEVRDLADRSGLTILVPSSGIARTPTWAAQPDEGSALPAPPGPPSGASQGRAPAVPHSSVRLAEVRGIQADARLTTWLFSASAPKTAKSKLATDEPALYLSDVWADLEGQLRSIYREATGREAFGWEEARAFLVQRGVLDEALGRLLDALRQTRNEVVHARRLTMTAAEAAEWGGIALTLSQRVDQRARMLGMIAGG